MFYSMKIFSFRIYLGPKEVRDEKETWKREKTCKEGKKGQEEEKEEGS